MDCSMQASLSFTISQMLKLLSIELVMPSNHLILCHPLFLLPSIFPSIRIFSNELALPRVAKVLELHLRKPINHPKMTRFPYTYLDICAALEFWALNTVPKALTSDLCILF